ncbi:hypothetical protein [Aureispira anguillae]|uniref:Putative beta-lactamase-inhibitor-like PepSY-like domain-containing protein n=1 Tax=Aureispira anguillae TaxID=2864201 RepID=A0A916DWM8_9BACT|nr:hypothetical protein [Aureispira anguillae]BDS14982.1 hypothetical protein AsAng_0057640 [Aureispira anguillae]
MSELLVPNEILRVFKEYYPEVSLSEVEWGWEVPAKIYEASFDNGEVDFEVEITVTGHLLLTEISMDLEDLPEQIVTAVNTSFEDHSLEGASMVQYSNGDISYELELKCANSGDEFEAHFREDGLFLAKGYDL